MERMCLHIALLSRQERGFQCLLRQQRRASLVLRRLVLLTNSSPSCFPTPSFPSSARAPTRF